MSNSNSTVEMSETVSPNSPAFSATCFSPQPNRQGLMSPQLNRSPIFRARTLDGINYDRKREANDVELLPGKASTFASISSVTAPRRLVKVKRRICRKTPNSDPRKCLRRCGTPLPGKKVEKTKDVVHRPLTGFIPVKDIENEDSLEELSCAAGDPIKKSKT